MKKITKLTPEQEARFPEFVQKWIKLGLSTEPADRPRAEAAIAGLYKLANLKEPRVIWLPCPISAALSAVCYASLIQHRLVARGEINKKTAVDSAVYSAVDSAVGSAVYSAVDSAVGSAVYSAVGSAVRSAVGSAVSSAVDSAVGSAVRSAVSSAVYSAVDSAVGSAVYSAVYSAVGSAVREAGYSFFGGALWNSGYSSWADFFNEVCGVAIDRNFLTMTESCGFYWVLDGICFASERPSEISLDESGLLHSEVGMSVRYAGTGWGLYHWHGVRVPDDWIVNRASLDPATVLKSENVEQRAAGAAIIGWPKMVDRLKRKIIDGDPDTDMGALIELTMPGLREPGRFLQAICVRNGTIVEGIPRVSDIDGKPIETAIAAQAWRVGLTQTEYRHPVHRT
jgi:phage baseplate assembly protein W